MLKKLFKKTVAIFVAVEGWVDMVALAVAAVVAWQAGAILLAVGLGLWSLSHIVMNGYAAYATWRS